MIKRFLVYAGMGILVFLFLASCGGGGGGGGASGSSLVSITVGGDAQTAVLKAEKNTFFARALIWFDRLIKSNDEAVAAIPIGVTKVVITITASDMSTISRDVVVTPGQSAITETFTVPNGQQRFFNVRSFDISDDLLYEGSAYANLNGNSIVLDILMLSKTGGSYSISGKAFGPYSWKTFYVQLSRPGFASVTQTQVDASTNYTYSFSGATGGITYTVTPMQADTSGNFPSNYTIFYIFRPLSKAIRVAANEVVNFIYNGIGRTYYSIYGTFKDSLNNLIDNVAVMITADAQKSMNGQWCTQTVAQQETSPNYAYSYYGGGSAQWTTAPYYYIYGAAPGETYTITPSKTGYTFNPPSVSINVSGNTSQDFIAVPTQ